VSIFGDGNKITYEASFPVESIKPRTRETKIYTNTAREAVRKSIQNYGVIEPLVINEEHYLVHGALRLEVIKELKIENVPVVVLRETPQETGTADLYHMLADRIVEWDKWETAEATKTLLELSDSTLHSGEKFRDFFKKIGWFTPDFSAKPTATEATVELIAHEKTKWAATKHSHFNEAQVLYIEALRRKVLEVREDLIARNETVGGVVEKYRRHLQEEEDKMIAGEKVKPQETTLSELKKTIKITKKPTLGERAKIQLKGESRKVHKEENSGRMMDRGPFINLATVFGEMTLEAAEEAWEKLSIKDFNKLCREIIDTDKQVSPPVSKVHPLAVGSTK